MGHTARKQIYSHLLGSLLRSVANRPPTVNKRRTVIFRTKVFTCAVPNNNTAVKAEDTTMSMVISRLPAPESSRWSGMSYKPPTLTPSPNTQLFRPQPRSRDSAGAGDLNNKPPHTVVSAIKVDKRPPRPTHPDLTDGLWTLVQRCWDQEPHSRPRALRMACGLYVSPLVPRMRRPDPSLDAATLQRGNVWLNVLSLWMNPLP